MKKFKILFIFGAVLTVFSHLLHAESLERAKNDSSQAFGELREGFKQNHSSPALSPMLQLRNISSHSRIFLKKSSGQIKETKNNSMENSWSPLEKPRRNVLGGIKSGAVVGTEIGSQPGKNMINSSIETVSAAAQTSPALGAAFWLVLLPVVVTGGLLLQAGNLAGSVVGAAVGAGSEAIKAGSTQNWAQGESKPDFTSWEKYFSTDLISQ